ncbi:MAG TPA: sterol desaturase family protein, partial [Acidimicrobiales bacterium]|nr:sterol desaturase family protein [Acidimicrobiales bacterium]
MVVVPVRSAPVLRDERPANVIRALGRAVTARVYVPACAIAVLASVLIGIGWFTGWNGANFSGSLQELHLVVVGPASLVVLSLIVVVERLRPAQRRPLVARGHRQDLLYTLLHATLGVLLITALTLSFQGIVERAAPWIVLPRMALIPHSVAIAVIFVAMDACNWSMHLANHRSRVLWRFHELHHSQEDMNVMTVFRTHPLIHVSYLLALVPGVVLLANGAVSTTLLIVYGGIVAFAHSNTNLGFGPLGRIFVSPNYHRIHHRVEGAQDVNLGFVLTIWDQLSRRAVFPTAETIRLDTGIPGRPLRVEQEDPCARHIPTFLAQLLGPFRPMPQRVE